MKKSIYKYKWLIILLIGLGSIVACSDLDETHQEYIKDGEQIYVGKPLAVGTQSGNERIKFHILITADPKISKGQITWNNNTESHDFVVTRTSEGFDIVEFELDVAEGSYTFNMILLDDEGNTSLTFEHSAVVYGPKYVSSLLNRAISNIEAFPEQAVITWSGAEEGVVETSFSYEDQDGEMQEVTILPEETETILEDYKIGGTYSVVTKYKPNEFALESFNSASEGGSLPSSVMLNRSLWQTVVLPTDAELNCYGGGIHKLWDGDKGSWYHNGCVGDGTDGIPHHFTIDLGVSAGLSKFKVSPRQECCQDRNPKKFQIWGIQDIEGAETTAPTTDPNWADDATEKGWVLLLDTETEASWSGSKDDYEVDIPENVSVKYIRFRFLEAHNGGGETALSEFVFWANSVE